MDKDQFSLLLEQALNQNDGHAFSVGDGVLYYHHPRPALSGKQKLHELLQKFPDRLGVADSTSAHLLSALLHFVYGCLDEAHDIVLDHQNVQEANYLHAIIHRKEGESCFLLSLIVVHFLTKNKQTNKQNLLNKNKGNRMGEAGLSGFSNAKYWFGRTQFHPLFPGLLKFAQSEASSVLCNSTTPLKDQILQWSAEGFPSKFVSLCKQSVDTGDKDLQLFCSKVQREEWRQLFKYCWEKAK